MGNERKNIMKRRFHDALLGIVGLAGVAFFALSGASCEKTEMQCAVGHGAFIIKYAVTSGDAACYPGGAAEEIGFSTYLASRPKTETITKAEDGENITTVTSPGADYNTRTIAIQSTFMGGNLQDRSGAGLKAASRAYAFGDYTSNPDDANVCFAGGGAVGAMSVADLDADAFDTGELDDMMMPIILPAFHYRQEWKNVRLYVTEGIPGTQAVGEMTFENLTAGEECTASYKFVALYPAVHCEAEILMDRQVDDDEDPATPSDNDDADPTKMDEIVIGDFVRAEIDDDLCLAAPEVGWTKPPPGTEYKPARVFGSGINPDFKTHCDVDLGYCVLDDNTALVQ
jgi:hypothetical protein